MPVFSLLLRLFALRPFFSMAIFGIPILTLVALGLFTAFVLKALLIVVPIALVVWLVARAMRSREPRHHDM